MLHSACLTREIFNDKSYSGGAEIRNSVSVLFRGDALQIQLWSLMVVVSTPWVVALFYFHV